MIALVLMLTVVDNACSCFIVVDSEDWRLLEDTDLESLEEKVRAARLELNIPDREELLLLDNQKLVDTVEYLLTCMAKSVQSQIRWWGCSLCESYMGAMRKHRVDGLGMCSECEIAYREMKAKEEN